MKILHLTQTMDTKMGVGRLTREVVSRLAKRGVDSEVITEFPSTDYPGEHQGLSRSYGIFKTLPQIRKSILSADLIHAWEVNPYGITAFLAGLGVKKPLILNANGTYSIQPLFRSQTAFLTRQTYRKANGVSCISRYVKKQIDVAVPGTKTEVINLGVDFDKFAGARVPGKERFIVGVGNVGRRKGYHISIPAFGIVAKKIPDIKYYIAGHLDKNFFERSQELIKEHDLEGRVVFLGPQNDAQLRGLYLSAELFILTSVNFDHHFEGFGLVFLEAAAAGVPVVGTRGNGIEDAMLDSQNGFLVDQNDINGTAEAMLTILEHKDTWSRFSAAGISWAKQNSWDSVVDRYQDLYARVS